MVVESTVESRFGGFERTLELTNISSQRNLPTKTYIGIGKPNAFHLVYLVAFYIFSIFLAVGFRQDNPNLW